MRRLTSCSFAPTTPSSRSGRSTRASCTPPSGPIVDTTVVAGRVLMRGGVVEGVDEVVAKARERAARLGLARSAA